jgi:hypothetical protein
MAQPPFCPNDSQNLDQTPVPVKQAVIGHGTTGTI